MRIRWARVLFPPLLVALGAAMAVQSTPVRLWLAWALTAPPSAAPPVSPRRATFDGPDAQRPRLEMRLEPLYTGVPEPTGVAWVPGHDRAVIVSQSGTAWLTRRGRPEAWLTVPAAREGGLVGVVFPPEFLQDGRFWLALGPTGEASVEARVDPRTLTRPTSGAEAELRPLLVRTSAVWRGPGPLSGQTVFGELGAGRLWATPSLEDGGPVEPVTALGRFDVRLSAVAVDPGGRVVVADLDSGAIFALATEQRP